MVAAEDNTACVLGTPLECKVNLCSHASIMLVLVCGTTTAQHMELPQLSGSDRHEPSCQGGYSGGLCGHMQFPKCLLCVCVCGRGS